MARDRPIATTVAAAAAVGAGIFLWSKRNQISDQLNDLSNQIGEWAEDMRGGGNSGMSDDTAGLTTTGSTGTGKMGRPRSDTGRSTNSRRGMSETGGGNSSLGARSGGGGTTGSPSGRGRARGTTPQATR